MTVLARDLEGKANLRFGGNVLPYKSAEALAADREAKNGNGQAGEPKPDGGQARASGKRAGGRKRTGPKQGS